MFGNLQRSRTIAYSAAFIGLISIGAWVSIPFFPVPLTLQTLFVLLAGAVMKRNAIIPVSLYVILGALGLPVFHTGATGFGILLGPTGGYLAGFILAALIVGLFYECKSAIMNITGLLAGTAIIYVCGFSWLMYSLSIGFVPAVISGVLPFIPGDLIKVYAVYEIAGTTLMITIENLRYRNLAIDALTLNPGITSIIGTNGSGKTTFLKICAGISLPDSGSVMIDGQLPRKTEIGWVNEFPDRNILFVNGFDEIASSLRFHHISCASIDSSVRSCAESMGITHLLSRPLREMSGGEKVLVSLAAALVNHPKVLIFDEYDSHLDFRSISLIDRILSGWGTDYVIRCTQQMDTAARSNHLLFFDSGRILHSGNPQQVIPLLEGTAWFPVLWGC